MGKRETLLPHVVTTSGAFPIPSGAASGSCLGVCLHPFLRLIAYRNGFAIHDFSLPQSR